ncbi:unnamed protein product [Adineta ricciae]|uniref:Ubiquitin carboxyl-terminal hydrolase n=1 Tax=Adineta ricciae TaxID=249248 RepID=A0A814XGS5_ADIRI|nr:unnamed protein product [Adineta ricciae]
MLYRQRAFKSDSTPVALRTTFKLATKPVELPVPVPRTKSTANEDEPTQYTPGICGLINIVTCLGCNSIDVTDETSTFLPLPLPKKSQTIKEILLEDLINDYCLEQPLDGLYYCHSCTNYTQAKQKTMISSPLPLVLIIQLKRFPFDGTIQKINTIACYKFQYKNLISRNDVYQLCAVSSRQGSLAGGHYVAFAKNYQMKQWYYFNDERVHDIHKLIKPVNRRTHMNHPHYPHNSFMSYDSYRPLQTIQYTSRTSSYLAFRLCTLERNRNSTTSFTMWSTDTIADLKEKVAALLNIRVLRNEFCLEVFDRGTNNWIMIDDSNPFHTLNSLQLYDGDVLSMHLVGRSTTTTLRSLYPSSYSGADDLTFYLCRKPFDRYDYTILTISSESTIGKLRRKAYEKLNRPHESQSLFLCYHDTWMKFESDMDGNVLGDSPFRSHMNISVDYDDGGSYRPVLTKGLCGLVNLANTCYMNSIFQCLSNIPEFTKKMLELTDERNAPITSDYKKLLEKLWSGQYRSFDPSSLVTNLKMKLPRYDNYRQQDAQEFMNYFLNLMQAELSPSNTLITDYFYGKIQSKVTCLECKNVEITNEPISFLPIAVSNCNQKSILYVKMNGEYHTVSVQIDASIRTIADLITCFLQQYEPSLTPSHIRAVKLVDNRFTEQYNDMKYLSEVQEEEIALLQCPDKTKNQKLILCEFVERSSEKRFRPPTVLVVPTSNCNYYDISDQLDDLLGHLCSITDASPSTCRLSWLDQNEQYYILDDRSHRLDLKKVRIDMPVGDVEVYRVHNHIHNSADQSTLKSLIADFFHEEPLDSAYHCHKCSQSTKAKQKSSLYLPLPQVLIIQLKRFTFDANFSEKIDTFISFPLNELDLSEYTVEDNNNQEKKDSTAKYNLVAVSNHIGSLMAGHYTTYAKNQGDNQWYLFNDTNVTKVNNEKEIVTKNAYILVYVRAN